MHALWIMECFRFKKLRLYVLCYGIQNGVLEKWKFLNLYSLFFAFFEWPKRETEFELG